VVYPTSKIAQQYYMKIILLVSHTSEEDILKVIEQNTFHRNSFIHMSLSRLVILM
jgi:tryptophan synthase alpha subunit